MTDRWKCPDCGKIIVDPPTVIAACGCGSERIQLRDWPAQGGDWTPPEWPDDSDYSPDPYEVENEIDHMGAKHGGRYASYSGQGGGDGGE